MKVPTKLAELQTEGIELLKLNGVKMEGEVETVFNALLSRAYYTGKVDAYKDVGAVPKTAEENS